MAISRPRLDSEELWTALEDIDPIAVVTEQLLGTTATAPCQGEPLRLDGHSALTATSLRALRTAALAALAARHLLEPGLITGCVLGSGIALQAQLTVATRYLADISHLAMCRTDRRGPSLIGSRLADRLDLAGIDWSITEEITDAVSGANLVLVADAGPRLAEIRKLTTGALLVNASGQRLPARLVKRASDIYVDDRRLLPVGGPGGWNATVAADLGQVLRATHAGRTRAEDVLLVELLSTNVLDRSLANRLHSAALRRALRMEWQS